MSTNDKFASPVLIFQPGNVPIYCVAKSWATGRYPWIPNYFDIPFYCQTLNSMFPLWPTVVQIHIRCLSNSQTQKTTTWCTLDCKTNLNCDLYDFSCGRIFHGTRYKFYGFYCAITGTVKYLVGCWLGPHRESGETRLPKRWDDHFRLTLETWEIMVRGTSMKCKFLEK